LVTPWARMHCENLSAARCAAAADGFKLAAVVAGLVEPQAANAIVQDMTTSAITLACKTGRDLVLLVTIALAVSASVHSGSRCRTRRSPC
jgi:hypothetical protein